MTWKILFNAFSVSLLSILLTGVSCFAQVPLVNRQAYVVAAYEEFHSLLNFLGSSERFLQGLTEPERAQFLLVGNSVVKHVIIWGPAAIPGQDRTSNRVDFKLKFSDRREDFILNPGEPERTAKMAGDIWFNLNVINNPQVKFGLLDAFQILFHEFGHKIGEQKNQVMIDSIAAKMRQYLASYYKESVLGHHTKVSTLVVPYISFDGNPVDYQFEPVVIVDHLGQAASARLNVLGNSRSAAGFHYSEGYSQAYERILLRPIFKLEDSQIKIEWQTSIRHSFVVADRYNYVNLYTNLDKARTDEKLDAFTEYQRLVQVITPDELARVANQEYLTKPLPLASINIEFQPYPPANDQSRWLQNLKMTAQSQDRIEYSAVVESDKPLKNALLLGEYDTIFFRFKGQVTSLGGNTYRLVFSLPAQSAREGIMQFSAVALNDSERWDLPEVVKMPLKKSVEVRSAIPKTITVLGKNQWHSISKLTEPSLNTSEIRWRFLFPKALAKMEQVDIMWVIPQDIWKDGKRVGARNSNLFEVIDRKDLIQTWIEGQLLVEVVATKASKILPTTVNAAGYELRDSGARAMVMMQLMDQNYNTTLTGTRLVPDWKSLFILDIPGKSAVNSCENLF